MKQKKELFFSSSKSGQRMKLLIWMCYPFAFAVSLIFFGKYSIQSWQKCVQCSNGLTAADKQTHLPKIHRFCVSERVDVCVRMCFVLVFIRNKMRKRLYISLHIIDIYLYVHVERWQRAPQTCLILLLLLQNVLLYLLYLAWEFLYVCVWVRAWAMNFLGTSHIHTGNEWMKRRRQQTEMDRIWERAQTKHNKLSERKTRVEPRSSESQGYCRKTGQYEYIEFGIRLYAAKQIDDGIYYCRRDSWKRETRNERFRYCSYMYRPCMDMYI